MIGAALVLGTLPSDAVLVLDQDAVGGEVELVPDGLEGHSDPLILEEEPGAILPEVALGFIRGEGLGVVEVHVDRFQWSVVLGRAAEATRDATRRLNLMTDGVMIDEC